MFQSLLEPMSMPQLARVSGYVYIRQHSLLLQVSLPSLSVVEGSFDITGNNAVTRVILSKLSYVKGFFGVTMNTSVTYVSVPLLTYIREQIHFCANHASFNIPSTTPVAPVSGLTSATLKGQQMCQYVSGTAQCAIVSSCP
jgi:hypothetical protein